MLNYNTAGGGDQHVKSKPLKTDRNIVIYDLIFELIWEFQRFYARNSHYTRTPVRSLKIHLRSLKIPLRRKANTLQVVTMMMTTMTMKIEYYVKCMLCNVKHKNNDDVANKKYSVINYVLPKNYQHGCWQVLQLCVLGIINASPKMKYTILNTLTTIWLFNNK